MNYASVTPSDIGVEGHPNCEVPMSRTGHLRTLKANAKGPRPNHAGQRRGPLRRIVGVIRFAEHLFEANYVELECGHRVDSNGAEKARCNFCLAVSR